MSRERKTSKMETRRRAQKSKAPASRSSQEQLRAYLKFVSKHPELKDNRVTNKDRESIDKLWEVLVEELNSLKGPTRSASQWQKSLCHWRNQRRSRVRKEQAYMSATENGTISGQISSIQDQTFSSQGNNTTVENDTFPYNKNSMKNNDHNKKSISPMLPEIIMKVEIGDSTDCEYGGARLVETGSGRSSTPKSSRDKFIEEVVQLIKRSEERQRNMLNNFLQTQSQMANALMTIGQGIVELAETLKNTNNRIVN